VLERLRGTPARAEEKRAILPAVEARTRRGEAWSMQEHLGHLLDLEELWTARLDDFLAHRAQLRAADLTNARTWEAWHNRRDWEELAGAFRRERQRLVARLESLGPAEAALSALHPRLGRPLRVIDHAVFVAEHDDHHLALMQALAPARG
jgi:uncharacterized damage-inducible protein DinB